MRLIRNMIRLLTTTASERSYFDACSDRETLSDTDFHQRFYRDSDVTLETCAGVRRVLCEQLRMCNTLPADNVADVFDDVDIAEVCFDIGEVFGVMFTDAMFQRIDGTVDSLIRATQHLTHMHHPT